MVRTADVNGDGKADVVAASTASNTVGVTLGNGNGTFSQPSFARGQQNPLEIAIADVDADVKPDLTVSNSSRATIYQS
ncbi:MAG: VCBS repeat-containing protein [Gammaproteobacteria bacterium]